MPITNPYEKTSSNQHKVSGRISLSDFRYVEKLFTCVTGLQDKIVSTIYSKLVNELRRLDAIHKSSSTTLDPNAPFECGWHTAHPNLAILETLLGQCNFGGSAGAGKDSPSGRDGQRRTSKLHKTVLPTSPVGTVSKGGAGKRKRAPRRDEEGDQKAGRSVPGTGVASVVDSEAEPEALKMLRQQGVL